MVRVKNEYPQYDVRVTILGHLQRGGSPTAHDRILASRLDRLIILDSFAEWYINDFIVLDTYHHVALVFHDSVAVRPLVLLYPNEK